MALTLEAIEALAPDQGALAAAGKLRKPSHWLQLAHDPATSTIWGECQGSGSNPYRVVADVADHGYKCTCPSRKFPCKHSLALMWKFVESPGEFAQAATVEWVQDWLGRRRRGAVKPEAEAGQARVARDIAAAGADQAPAEERTEQDIRRTAAATAKRREQTQAGVQAGLEELQQWIADQLRGGVAAFLEDAPARCRRIASRLVDAKATTLASRVDELPSRLFALPRTLRLQGALHELGQLVLLARAWIGQPDDPDAYAHVLQSPRREAVLADPQPRRLRAQWEVVGNQVETRRDGLVSQATWLMQEEAEDPHFALLLDFFPASAGRRTATFAPGQRLDACVGFYPGRYRLRGLLESAQAIPGQAPAATAAWGHAVADPCAEHRAHLARVPWAQQTPLRLGAGRVGLDAGGQHWWLPADASPGLPLAPMGDDLLWRGIPARSAVVLWDGFQGRMLRLDTPMGVAYPHG